jgi:hypothetical protein
VTEDSSINPQDSDGARGVHLMRGRFEARFEDVGSAQAAARDARAVRFDVAVRQIPTGWLIVGRRQLPFPVDERDRYASRFRAIASQHRGKYDQFVEEPMPSAVLEPRVKGRE